MYDIQPSSAVLYGKAAVYNFVHSFYGKKPKPLVRSCKKTHLSLQKPKHRNGGAKENIKGEFAQNGVKNDLKHTRGVISMARSMMPDSASSQFFIMHKDAPHLDGGYAAFGKVVDGMDAVDEIADTEVDWNDKPTTPQVMKRVYIED